MPIRPLSLRALNRAALARQMLLARETKSPAATIEQLAGMQAQLPRPPFIGLWSRLESFKRDDLRTLLDKRKVVRATMMRATIHLVTTKDFLKLRPALNTVLGRTGESMLSSRTRDYDRDAILDVAAKYFADQARTFEEVRDHLAKRFPKVETRAMAYMVRLNLPLVMAPSDHEWGFQDARFALAEPYLKKPIPGDEDPAPLLMRYFAAFGPATVTDAQTWSGLRGVRAVIEKLRPKLAAFRDERGRELFDIPDAPRPLEDTPAPVRFLPDFDNLLLAYGDRERIIAGKNKPAVYRAGLGVEPSILVDGFAAGTWKIARKARIAALTIKPFTKLDKRTRDEVAAEGDRLLRFVEPQAAAYDVRFQTLK